MMKAIALGVLLFFASTAMADEAEYDGIWYSSHIGYVSVHERHGNIIIIRLSDGMGLWEAFIGPRNGQNFRVETIRSPSAHSVLNVIMTTENTFSATQESCQPSFSCLLPDGFTFTGTKVW
jgi:hypothetical protein